MTLFALLIKICPVKKELNKFSSFAPLMLYLLGTYSDRGDKK